MSDFFVPPAASETACTQRGGFRAGAVETALAALLGTLSDRAAFVPGKLPDKLDGIGAAVTEFPEPEAGVPGSLPVVVTLEGRSADPGFRDAFSLAAAAFPREHDESRGVRFSRIERKDAGSFAETLHHGIPKTTAKLALLCHIDLARSQFGAGETAETPTAEAWSDIPFAAVERGVASLLGIRTGTLPEEEETSAVRVTGSAPAEDLRYRDFTLELAVRTAGCSGFERELARLTAKLPAVNISCSGVTFNAVWCSGTAAFVSERILEREYGCGKLALTARVDVASSQGADGTPVSYPPDRSVTAFDPAALERALAARIGAELGLTVDRELCRGEFPPPGCGVRPVAAVKLTGIVSGNRPSGFRVHALLQLRAPHRDELFRRLLALDALLPRYGEALGGISLRAILKREFKLEWKEENGRNMLNAALAIELAV